MNTMLRILRGGALLAGVAAAVAGPALAAFRDDIARELGMTSATLVAPVGNEWIIDVDASDGVQVGDLFAVVDRGALVVHPVSQEVLGTLEETRAVLRVVRIKGYYSYAIAISPGAALEAGNKARRFAGMPVHFYDYTGTGEALFTRLQGALPGLNWQPYVAAARSSEQLPMPADNAPGLVFVLDARGLAIKDHQLQPLRFYRAEQLERWSAPVPEAVVDVVASAPPAADSPGDRPRPAPPGPGKPVGSETVSGAVTRSAPPAGSLPPPAAPAPLRDAAAEPPPAPVASPQLPVAVEPSAAPPARAAAGALRSPADRDELPVALAADQLDYDGTTRLVHARGAVTLQQGALQLEADELLWQELLRDVIARGRVRLHQAGGELQGSEISANFTTGLGRIAEGRLLVRDGNFHLAGAEIERRGETSYRVVDGRFTTCDGDDPDWQFTAGQVDVDLGRYATARDVWFEAGGQRLVYLPYLLFPVKSERESGFLLPRVGYSSRKGAILSLAWYEVIDRHLDATIAIDYLSRLGLGAGAEFRYVLGSANPGELHYYHVSGVDDAPDSYALAWRHDGTLPGGVRLAADIEYVSRREYFEDFGEAVEEYNRNYTKSTVLLQRNWDKLNLTGHLRYLKDLENDNDATLQRLPELGLDLPLYRLGATPVYLRTELRGTNFWREDGEEGGRLFLRQGVGLVFKPGGWLEFTPEVAVYGRAYHTDAGDESELLAEYAATAATRLVRDFTFARWGIERLQHSIEPQVRYVYLPNRDQDALPLFDRDDRLGPLNQVEYALVNRLTARIAAADGRAVYREVFNLRLSQAYDIHAERDDSVADPEPFTDLRTELTMRPTGRSFVELDAFTRVHDALKFSRLSAGAGIEDEHGNLARFAYRYRSADLPVTVAGDRYRPTAAVAKATDYLRVELATARFAPLHFSLIERYDFRNGTALETVVGLEYRARCWSLFLTFRDRPDDEEILVGFALSGLGRVGDFGSAVRPRQEAW